MKKILLYMFIIIFFVDIFSGVFTGSAAFGAENKLECTPVGDRMQCRIQLSEFVQSISSILGNGWENKLFFDIFLIDESQNVVSRSSLSAQQRCYIDPFESPCLLLWSGADSWQQYRDIESLRSALTVIKVKALSLRGLVQGHYSVQVIIRLNPLMEEQIVEMREWLRQNGQSGGVSFGQGDPSLIGRFMDAFSALGMGSGERVMILNTGLFYLSDANQ